MGRRKNLDKGSKQFRNFLKIYAGVLLLAIIVVCAILWGKLKRYQNRYDDSEKSANPDLYVDEFIKDFSTGKLLQYIDTYGINVKEGINPVKNHAAYFYDMAAAGVRYERNENFAKARPVYDIYSLNTRIAVISLKADGKNDQFGFHKWTLKDMAFDTDKIEYGSIEVIVPYGSVVLYNGEKVPDEYIKNTSSSEDAVLGKVIELGIEVPRTTRYVIRKTFGNFTVEAADADGNVLNAENDNGKFNFCGAQAVMDDEVKQRVLDTVDAYIYTIYSKMSFEESSRYVEYGSEAYAIISDVLASVLWGWKPETVDILEQAVTDYTVYNDTTFACSYYGRIYKYKEGSMESGEETFNYRLLFRKYDGQWYLNYFVIV